MKVVFRGGHGGKDPGAVSHGIEEDDITFQVAETCRIYAESHGLTAINIRGNQHYQTLDYAAALVNAAGPDLFVEIHCNASPNPAAHGAQTFYCPGSNNGGILAGDIQREFIKAGFFSRGITAKGFYMLEHTNPPAVLVEVSFITNDQDREVLSDPLGRNKIAGCIVRGVLAYGRAKGLIS